MAKLLVSDEARKEFATLRRTFDEVNSTLQTKFSQEPEPIDWEYYRKGIGSRLIDMYKEAYESVEIPKFVDTVTPQYKPKFDALLVELKEAEEKSLKESERLEKEIAEVQELKILGCLTVVTFFGASNSDETESVMKLLWDLINPGTDSSIERKDSLAILTVMISAWSFLLFTIDGWRLSHKNWQGAITYFSNILDSNDEALCAAACEALALVFEFNCMEKFSSKTKDSNKELKDNIIKQLRSRLSETGNERISSQDPRTGFNSVSATLDFLEVLI